MMNLDRVVGVGLGMGLSLVSFSGLKCISSYNRCSPCVVSDPCDESRKDNCSLVSRKCSSVNLTLGLSSLLLSGVLITYKNIRG